MTDRISQRQLESYLWGAAVLLRGTIDAGDYKQFIFPLLFYKRLCDVFDEETQIALKESGGDADFAAYPENHRFQIPREAHWREIRQVAKNLGRAIQNGMRAIESANQEKLYGIFGDAQWTNKDRLSDAMLRDLIEHFSALELTIANLPEDELGQGYEYLIKKFADDSGHTAAEFYTNRTVVHLMTEMLEPQPGESIYDPTCGSGGMLLSCIAHLRHRSQEWRNVRLYGQERNLMTSSIARMNCFLHGIEDFQIVRGDTLSDPKFVEGDRLKRFDLVLANPPYSIKQWDRDTFSSDPWGRNLYGTPPQGRADYAFWQHIICSLTAKTGRCAILFPHGVLFRQDEAEMRRKLIEADLLDCIVGLGPNLFYNSPMEACIVICCSSKPKVRKGKILFINAVNEVSRERAQSFLTDEHIERIVRAYRAFNVQHGFARAATVAEARFREYSLAIPLYVETPQTNSGKAATETTSIDEALTTWLRSRQGARTALAKVLPSAQFRNRPARLTQAAAVKFLRDGSRRDRVRFSDVVENVNESVSDPGVVGLDRFVGLEHLEPGSLRIRTWGAVSEGTTFTRRCRPGQVLFGKRRAYQRKVALAEFDAVVSGDIYVLKAKGGLWPGLLPFICLSERFFQHAIGTSAGSLSPRTNWSSLASFEFDLPIPDVQERLAEMLMALDDVRNRDCEVVDRLVDLRAARLAHLYRYGLDSHELIDTALGPRPRSWEVAPLYVHYEVQLGKMLSPKARSGAAQRPYIRNANVQWNRLDLSDVATMSFTKQEAKKFELKEGDILACEGRHVGKSAIWRNEIPGACYQKALHRIRARQVSQVPEFMLYQMEHHSLAGLFADQTRETTIPHLPAERLREIPFAFPPANEQRAIAHEIHLLTNLVAMVGTHLTASTRLVATLANALVGDGN